MGRLCVVPEDVPGWVEPANDTDAPNRRLDQVPTLGEEETNRSRMFSLHIRFAASAKRLR